MTATLFVPILAAAVAAGASPEEEFRAMSEALRKAEAVNGQSPALAPRPAPPDLARAEKDAADIFGDEVEAARKPADKAALAAKMLATARKLDDDPAGRYVLAVQARNLAVAGGDAKTAVRAAELLAGYQPSAVSPQPSAKEAAARGHDLWAEAEKLRGQEQLAKRVEAAEWYFRAFDGLEGLEAQLAAKRLAELGWSRVLTARETMEQFPFPTWRIDGEALVGQFRDIAHPSGWAWGAQKESVQSFDFSFEMLAPKDLAVRADVDRSTYIGIFGAERNTSIIWRFQGATKTEPFSMKAPNEWHRVGVAMNCGEMSFFFDGKPFRTISIAEPPIGHAVRLAIGHHYGEAKVRSVQVRFQ